MLEETSIALVPVWPIFFHGKTWGRIHFRKPAFGTYPIIASPQRFLATVAGVENLSAMEDDRGEGVGTVAGGMTTATAEATADEIARAARRGDEAGSGQVALFLGRPDGMQAAEAPAAAGERTRF